MKKRYLILTALLALSLAALFDKKKQKMKMAQLKQNKQPKLMEQSEVRLKELPRKKQKWLIKVITIAFRVNTMKSS